MKLGALEGLALTIWISGAFGIVVPDPKPTSNGLDGNDILEEEPVVSRPDDEYIVPFRVTRRELEVIGKLAYREHIARRSDIPDWLKKEDIYEPPDYSWDENLAAREISPNAFPQTYGSFQDSSSPLKGVASPSEKSKTAPSTDPELVRRQRLEVMSFNVQPDVVDDDPTVVRMNPARIHQEFLCHWRTPVDGFDLVLLYKKLTEYLETYPTERCGGPGGYCSPVYCTGQYLITVCHYSDDIWDAPCSDIISWARDLLIALNNRDKNGWEKGVQYEGAPQRSHRQRVNDQKKMCIVHSSVYTPEMIGYTWKNTNPLFQVQLYYGIPEERVPCQRPDRISQEISPPKSRNQKDYMKDWYGVFDLDEDLETDEDGGPKPGGIFPLTGNFTTIPPHRESITGRKNETGSPYIGTYPDNYPELAHVPPGLHAQYLYEKQMEKIRSKLKTATFGKTKTSQAKPSRTGAPGTHTTRDANSPSRAQNSESMSSHSPTDKIPSRGLASDLKMTTTRIGSLDDAEETGSSGMTEDEFAKVSKLFSVSTVETTAPTTSTFIESRTTGENKSTAKEAPSNTETSHSESTTSARSAA